jgi:alpha-galactosidase/6-phospho-beta-glucosidase family protein
MKQAAYDEKIRPIDLFGDKMTHEQHIPIMNGLVNNVEGQFQVNIPNNGVLPGIPNDVAVEVPAIVNKKGIQPVRVPPLPKKIMLECILPHWLNMEQGLEALLSGDNLRFRVSIHSHRHKSHISPLLLIPPERLHLRQNSVDGLLGRQPCFTRLPNRL